MVVRIQPQGEKKIKRNKRAEREKERVSNKQARRRLTPQWELLHMKNRKQSGVKLSERVVFGVH